MMVEQAPSRRERAAAHARMDILNAAASAFARAGYSATKMSDIATEAGYTAASLYTYFPSKRAIFKAMGELLLVELLETLDRPLPGGLDTEQALEVRLFRLFEWVEGRRDGFKVLFAMRWSGEPDLAPEPGEPDHTEGETAIQARFQAWFSEPAAVGADAYGGRPPEFLASALHGLIMGSFMLWLTGPDSGSLASQAPMVTEFSFHGTRGRS